MEEFAEEQVIYVFRKYADSTFAKPTGQNQQLILGQRLNQSSS